MKIRNERKAYLILCLISITIIYPLFTILLSTYLINVSSQQDNEIKLDFQDFNQFSLYEWDNSVRSSDKNKNGINDKFEIKLEMLATQESIPSSYVDEYNNNKKLENRVYWEDSKERQILKNNIPIIITFPDGVYDSIKDYFGSLGGTIKSTYKKAVNGFAGTIDYDNLYEFVNKLNENNISFLIEEDSLFKAQLYYASRNMNLRPYVWNNLSYNGDYYSSVAILDTGIDDSHDFFGLGYSNGDPNYKIIGWQDEVNGLSMPYDDNSHGTHCAGIATGEGYPNYDYLGRSVSTASYELSDDNTGIISPGIYEVNWVRFNVTNPGLIEIPTEFQDLTIDPDDVDFWAYLYYGDTLVDSYINDSDMWTHNLSYSVSASELGLYSFRFDFQLSDNSGDGYVYDWDMKFRSEIHWPFSPNLYEAGDPWIGIAPDTHLVGVKVLDQYGWGTLSDIVDGINWAISNKNNYNITTISMSLGGGGGQISMIDAVNNAVENGIVTVVAAGNSGPGFNYIGSPGDADNVITVASMNINDEITSYSSQGGSSYTENTLKPDITAPGGSFYNLQMFSADTNDNDAEGGYPTEGYIDDLYGAQGTSMATPAVAGAANLLIEAMGSVQSWSFTATEAKRVKALLLMSATELYPLYREDDFGSYSPVLNRGGKDIHEGYGRTNVDVAIEAYTQQLSQGSQKSAYIYSSIQDPFNKHGLGCYVNLVSGNNYVFNLEVPDGSDFDLHLYSNNPSSIGEPNLLASGISSELGTDEFISFTATETGKYYLIAKAISGEGNATINYPILEHDLGVSLDTPFQPEIFNTYLINATIFNNGNNDESNVNLSLYLDDILVNSTTITTFQAGANDTITYQWQPSEYRTFNFTAYTPPIMGEIVTINNIDIELITLSSLRNYTMTPDYTYNWISATSGTELMLSDDGYSSEILPFDFTFYNETFSSVYVGSNGYLSFTNPPTDYTNDPIPSSDPDNSYLIAPFWDDLNPSSGGGGGNIYVQSFGTYWIVEWLNIEHFSGMLVGTFEVILYDSGEIVFNYNYLDYTSAGYTCGLNLGVDNQYYNNFEGLIDTTDNFSIKFDYESYEHDLDVTLGLPPFPEVNNSYIIDATVLNRGNVTESDVELELYLDDVMVNTTGVFSLPEGSSETITYNWTPTEYGVYNFTAYASPVENETLTSNNRDEVLLQLVEIQLSDGLYLNHSVNFNGTLGFSSLNYSQISLYDFHIDWNMNIGSPIYGYWDEDARTRIMSNSGGDIYFGDGYHTPVWIFNNINISDNILIAVDGEGDHLFNVSSETYYELPDGHIVEAWELIDLTLPGGKVLYEKSTGLLLYGLFYWNAGTAFYEFNFQATNANFSFIIFDHDLKVEVDVPNYCELGFSYSINATVINQGTYSETDVELYLYFDGLMVNSTVISDLNVGQNYSITYEFSPTVYGLYNFTGYATPVIGEIYTSNNQLTRSIPIKEIKLFDGLYIDFLMSVDTVIGPARIVYTHLYGNIFHVEWDATLDLYNYEGAWNINAYTRIMSDNQGNFSFGYGQHTPIWIFTDVSIGDVVPIGVISETDHSYNVTGEYVINFPGFGYLEVWELQDMDFPGGYALYEKSMGILINGTFMYFGGLFNYSLEMVDTNALPPISILPGDFTLSTNAGIPDIDGEFDLSWTSSTGADNYSVYQHSSIITEINDDLTNIAYQTAISPFSITGLSDGTYYFILVAYNEHGTTLSNCIEVIVSKPSPLPQGIPGYNLMLLISLLGLISILIIKSQINKSIKKT